MSDKIISVSIIGVGSRGGDAYGTIMNSMPDKYNIVALCDYNKEKTDKYKKVFNVNDDMVFADEETFFSKRRSDLLVIATYDKDHVRIAKKAIRLGYDILLEKPISNDVNELLELRDMAKEHGAFVMVCHVLRYTWANRTIMEILKSKRLGKLIHIDHTEQIAYWHFAHSYTRGNWRNTDIAAPMIMAKSCHDLDLLQQYADSPCDSLSSVGSLTWFKSENAPDGCAERCLDCKYRDTCSYSAKIKYLDQWEKEGQPQWWPWCILSVEHLTRDVLENALRNGPYGKCVFKCDNNVADNQSVMISFQNGVKATFRATAFTKDTGRITIFYCSDGQIVYEESKGVVIERPFIGDDVVHSAENAKDAFGHGGGDEGLIGKLYEALSNKIRDTDTSLDKSIESHLMAIAAEDSRLRGGAVVYLKNYRENTNL